MPTRQLNINLSEEHFVHLAKMAKEAGEKPSTFAKRVLETLLDDDATAHAEVEEK